MIKANISKENHEITKLDFIKINELSVISDSEMKALVE